MSANGRRAAIRTWADTGRTVAEFTCSALTSSDAKPTGTATPCVQSERALAEEIAKKVGSNVHEQRRRFGLAVNTIDGPLRFRSLMSFCRNSGFERGIDMSQVTFSREIAIEVLRRAMTPGSGSEGEAVALAWKRLQRDPPYRKLQKIVHWFTRRVSTTGM